MNKCLAVGMAVAVASIAARIHAGNWPEWRGPTGDGITIEKDVPVSWNATENVLWKTEIKGKGESTPVIWGDRIFLTTQTGDNPAGKPPPSGLTDGPVKNDEKFNAQVFTQCYDRNTGKLLWEKEVKIDELMPAHKKHNMATPSCVVDGERVYSWFGCGPLVCYDFDGNVVWERNLAKEYGPFLIIWGHGSSPTLYGESLILLCDHTQSAYILAVDRKTGKNLWRADRGKGARSYSTPKFMNVAGNDQMIVNTAGRVEGLNPANGDPIWKARGLLQVPVPSPIRGDDDILYTYGGFSSGPIFAIKLGGEGDVTDTNIIWSKKNGGPYVPSLLYSGGYLYMVRDDGIAHCFDGKTGDVVWKERIGGNFSSSPVLAGGKIYIISEDGETVVLDASPTFKVVSRNPVEEYTLASIVPLDGKIYFRTDKHLYCIGEAQK